MLKKNYLLILLITLSNKNYSSDIDIKFDFNSANTITKILLTPVILGELTGATIGVGTGVLCVGLPTWAYESTRHTFFTIDTEKFLYLTAKNSLIGGAVGLYVGAIVGGVGSVILMIYGGYKGTVILYKKIKEYLK
jgi:hypothetical protein